MTTIKQLENIENILRKKLEESSLKVSKVDQMIGSLNQSLERANNSSRQSINSSRSRKYALTPLKGRKEAESKISIGKTNDGSYLITSIEGELLEDKKHKTSRKVNRSKD